MPPAEMEARLAALEREVARLKARVEGAGSSATPWWEPVAGTFADDPAHDRAAALGQQYRASFRPRPARPKKT